MKMTMLFLLIFILPFCLYGEGEPQKVPSTIKEVTVFRKGAQVTREAKASLPTGKSQLKFTGISPQIDKRSVQLKADGNFTILSVVHQLNFFEKPTKTAEIENLEKQLKELRRQYLREKASLDVFKEEEALLLANRSIGGQHNGVSITDLQAAAQLYRQRLADIKLKKLEIDWKLADIKKEEKQTTDQLKQLNAERGKHTSEIVVTVNAKAALTADFVLSYIVQNAGWFPLYDLRVKDVQSPVELTYKANVYQTSSEDWKDVLLTLSTSDPRHSGTRPELQPWKLTYYVPGYAYSGYYIDGQRLSAYPGVSNPDIRHVSGVVTDENGELLIGVNVILEGTTIGTVTDWEGKYSLAIPYHNKNKLLFSYVGYPSIIAPITSKSLNISMNNDGVVLDEAVITSLGSTKQKRKKDEVTIRGSRAGASIPVPITQVEKATTVEFKIDLPYTVLSDGKQYTVDVKQHEVPAYYEYYAVPKLDPHAYLTAQVTDWEDYQLLSGEANLFFEGTYIGKSLLEVEHVEDTLYLSLGRDDNIVVQRNKQKEFSTRQFIGNKKTERRGWEIELRNKKSQSVNIEVVDQIPLSTTEEIEVESDIKRDGKLDKEEGKISWKLRLAPGSKETVGFSYKVRYPKKKQLQLE